jgi:hypothetical protein
MKKQLRDEWVKALRSGKYEQTTETLEADGAYCCLGVLCIVAGLWIPEDENDLDDDSGSYPELRALRDRCGLGDGHAATSLQTILIKMNDAELLCFDEIADWIEANVPVEP